MNNSSTSTASPIKKWAIIAAIAILVAAILYGVGRFQGNAALNSQRAEYETKLNTAQADAQKAQSQLIEAKNRGFLMEASAALYRTATDLDSRNFGTANTHLQEAATALSRVENAGADGAQISQLQRDIASKNINVAINLGSQRAQVIDFAKQLNALIPPADTTPATAAPATAAPVDMNAPQATPTPAPALETPATSDATNSAPSISDSIDAEMNNSTTNSGPTIGDNAVQ